MKTHDSRNEFQWEDEIRCDERRISRYFRELPGCLDLPGEEDMIFDHLAARPDPAIKGASSDYFRRWEENEDENEDDYSEENGAYPGGVNPLWRLDYLAVQWNMVAASLLDRSLVPEALAVSCAFGKLQGRMEEFLEPGPHCEDTLRVSLAKRSLSDLNDLYGLLRDVTHQLPKLQDPLALQLETLSAIREQIIEFLKALRNEDPAR